MKLNPLQKLIIIVVHWVLSSYGKLVAMGKFPPEILNPIKLNPMQKLIIISIQCVLSNYGKDNLPVKYYYL